MYRMGSWAVLPADIVPGLRSVVACGAHGVLHHIVRGAHGVFTHLSCSVHSVGLHLSGVRYHLQGGQETVSCSSRLEIEYCCHLNTIVGTCGEETKRKEKLLKVL